MTDLSILNLAPLRDGETFADAVDDLVALAQLAERLGYTRYWIAEHHNMPYLASSATSLLIGHVLDKTNTIRVGSGGVMLPNHSPFIVAEQYGTHWQAYIPTVWIWGLGERLVPTLPLPKPSAVIRTILCQVFLVISKSYSSILAMIRATRCEPTLPKG